MEWISVGAFMPPALEKNEWAIVRAIDGDLNIFFFMAKYEYELGRWNLGNCPFSHNKKIITHWCMPDEVCEEIITQEAIDLMHSKVEKIRRENK